MKLLSPLLFVSIGITSQIQAQTQTLAPSVAQPTPTLAVRGDVQKPRTWTLTQLRLLASAQTIKTTLKGKPYTARGVPLWALIEAAAPRLDSKTKHSDARFVVLARGEDGYLASFALPELMPEAGNKGAFLIWEAGGKPLSAREGPFRLVVPGDKKPMRWVYNLVGLEIYDGKRLGEEKPPQQTRAS